MGCRASVCWVPNDDDESPPRGPPAIDVHSGRVAVHEKVRVFGKIPSVGTWLARSIPVVKHVPLHEAEHLTLFDNTPGIRDALCICLDERLNRLYVGLSTGIGFVDLEAIRRGGTSVGDILTSECNLLIEESEPVHHILVDGSRLLYVTAHRLVSVIPEILYHHEAGDSAGYISKTILLDGLRHLVGGTAVTSNGSIYFIEFEKPNTNLCRLSGNGPYEKELVRKLPFEKNEHPGGIVLVQDDLFAVGTWKLPAPAYNASVMIVPLDTTLRCWKAVDEALATNMVLAMDASGCLYCAGRYGKLSKPGLEAFPAFVSSVTSGGEARERIVFDDPQGSSNISAMTVSRDGDVFYVTTAGPTRLRRIFRKRR